MIFSLNTSLIPIVNKVLQNNEPVAYSWGNVDALHNWIEAMNKKQIEKSLGMLGAKKYPLIWLVEGWKGSENNMFIDFDKVVFYISENSKIGTLNENRVPNFESLYAVANEFIKQLKRNSVVIKTNSIEYSEKANFSTNKKTETSDVWDTLILTIDLSLNTRC